MRTASKFSIFVLNELANSVLQTMQLVFTYLKTLKLHIFYIASDK